MEIFDIWFSSFPQLMMSNFGSKMDGYSIVDVTSNVHDFNLEIIKENLSMKHDSSHFLQCSIFTFNHSIFLWSKWCIELMSNSV